MRACAILLHAAFAVGLASAAGAHAAEGATAQPSAHGAVHSLLNVHALPVQHSRQMGYRLAQLEGEVAVLRQFATQNRERINRLDVLMSRRESLDHRHHAWIALVGGSVAALAGAAAGLVWRVRTSRSR